MISSTSYYLCRARALRGASRENTKGKGRGRLSCRLCYEAAHNVMNDAWAHVSVYTSRQNTKVDDGGDRAVTEVAG